MSKKYDWSDGQCEVIVGFVRVATHPNLPKSLTDRAYNLLQQIESKVSEQTGELI